MDEQTTSMLADKLVSDISFWTALIGLGDVVTGAVIAIIGNIVIFKMQNRQQKDIDTARKELLHKMLADSRFKDGRSLETLCKVTGSQPDECRRLLIEMKARGFTLADGREGWVYIKNRPLITQ